MSRRGDAPAEPAASALVEAARRLDWRFLLPDPELGSTVCVGPVAPETVASLRLLARSVVRAEEQAAERQAHDLAVLESPSRDDLARAAHLVRPGGWVHVELRRALLRRATGAPASPGAVAAELARHGFDPVEAYWHFPHADRREGIVSLHDREAIRHVLTRRPRTASAAAREGLARALLAMRLFPSAVSSAGVLARRAAL